MYRVVFVYLSVALTTGKYNIVDFGDIDSLHPSFQSKLVEKGKEEFNAALHITKPVVKLMPSRRYFTLTGITYERVEAPAKKPQECHSWRDSTYQEKHSFLLFHRFRFRHR